MTGREPVTCGDWAYLSLASSIPGLSVRPRAAVHAQFAAFEATAVALSAWYDLWPVLPIATAAIGVSTAGSGMMVAISGRIRELPVPAAYGRFLFDASVDIVMGLTAYIVLVTYLIVEGRGASPGGLAGMIGTTLPTPAVFFALLVAWDVCYRMGTGWWASVTGLWRSITLDRGIDDESRRGYARVDLLVIGFAGLQLALVPFLWAARPLAVLVVGHVAAVLVVSVLSIGVLLRR